MVKQHSHVHVRVVDVFQMYFVLNRSCFYHSITVWKSPLVFILGMGYNSVIIISPPLPIEMSLQVGGGANIYDRLKTMSKMKKDVPNIAIISPSSLWARLWVRVVKRHFLNEDSWDTSYELSGATIALNEALKHKKQQLTINVFVKQELNGQSTWLSTSNAWPMYSNCTLYWTSDASITQLQYVEVTLQMSFI